MRNHMTYDYVVIHIIDASMTLVMRIVASVNDLPAVAAPTVAPSKALL